ncbi:SDR family NAD(P)-dependent oxidoreductase [Bordetella hinzii]|uniref:SDR family NAD(P)-dependent oxidoreductase n=1 Tax=Bordetella hinzii TaxID=103855 RepID=UPI001154D8C8|nr:SDR family NAD(P)-dependent oxidoreductase [Bordetella hinzii]QDJ34734.1 short-chain dehydrogenase [Bordetella hinzii]QDJ52878.1 short-chain dehydrogenase [Bordetella hinzii]
MKLEYLGQTFGLAGRTALVTGAARGLGYAIATALGQAGARVVINDLDAAACEGACQGLAAEGISARAAAFDVGDAEAVAGALGSLAADGTSIDILVSNAGNQNRKPIVDMQPEEWLALQNVHVNGAFHCARAVLPGMVERGFGRIVLMSSVAGQATMPNIAAYATAKGALAAFTRALAVEYGGKGVTCNALAPGFVRTDFTQGLQDNPQFQSFLDSAVPAGRWASPGDIAPAVVYLASPAAAFVNGHVLAIDGGLLARM